MAAPSSAGACRDFSEPDALASAGLKLRNLHNWRARWLASFRGRAGPGRAGGVARAGAIRRTIEAGEDEKKN